PRVCGGERRRSIQHRRALRCAGGACGHATVSHFPHAPALTRLKMRVDPRTGLLCAALAASACVCNTPVDVLDDGGGGGGDGGALHCLDGASSVTIAPPSQQLTVGLSPAPLAFTATATLGGAAADVTSQVAW